jgi:hypothetical protein
MNDDMMHSRISIMKISDVTVKLGDADMSPTYP